MSMEQYIVNLHDRIFNLVTAQDEITWQALLMELVKSDDMDPWDIDISHLTRRYIEALQKIKGWDLRVSGKMVFAAAILLRIKATHLLTEDITGFDSLLAGEDELLLEEEESAGLPPDILEARKKFKHLHLIPRTPQPRKRKVSIYELIDALQQALEVEKKRRLRIPAQVKIELPQKRYDITDLMTKLYERVLGMFKRGKEITFDQLVPVQTKEGKVITFLPLLHLANQRKIDLIQAVPFGEIAVKVIEGNIEKEIAREEEAY